MQRVYIQVLLSEWAHDIGAGHLKVGLHCSGREVCIWVSASVLSYFPKLGKKKRKKAWVWRVQFSKEAILSSAGPIIIGSYQRVPTDSKYMLYVL